MENKDLKYNTVLDKLRKAEVILDDAEGLTAGIMQRVEQMTADAGRVRMMRLSGIISGVAASALICLFAYETLKYPLSPMEKYSEIQWPDSGRKMSPYKIAEFEENKKVKVIYIRGLNKKKETQRSIKERLSAHYNTYAKE